MDEIKNTYPQYFDNNPNIVFKSCENDWIVVLNKTINTVTNESRNNVSDEFCAKFRGNDLFVSKIFNKLCPSVTINEIRNTSYTKKTTSYIVNTIIHIDNYDNDINVIQGSGIHYFKSISPAFYYEFKHKHCELITYHTNGLVNSIISYLNYQIHGTMYMYHKNGNISEITNMYFGLKHGPHIYYHKNGLTHMNKMWDHGELIWSYTYSDTGKMINKFISSKNNYKKYNHYGNLIEETKIIGNDKYTTIYKYVTKNNNSIISGIYTLINNYITETKLYDRTFTFNTTDSFSINIFSYKTTLSDIELKIRKPICRYIYRKNILIKILMLTKTLSKNTHCEFYHCMCCIKTIEIDYNSNNDKIHNVYF
jgi:antitoxin component YwqK of YwqJK toxin-antitoxin module